MRRQTNCMRAACAFLLCLFISVKSFSLPSAQKDALYDLYQATGGEKWKWKLPLVKYGDVWNFSTSNYNPCNDWQGIICSSTCKFSPCSVTSLDLVGYGLDGTLPSSLSNLNTLTTFALAGSKNLQGEIPPQLQMLTELTLFSLANNNISGTIPNRLFLEMKQLQTIYLAENALRGTIPAIIGNIKSLERFDVFYNHLDGPIPSTFGNLSNIRMMNLSYNHLTGTLPESLGNCKSLIELRIDNNLFHGPLPQSFGNLQNLSQAILSTNLFTGSIPDYFFNASNLFDLEMAHNYLTGKLSPNAFRLKHIGAFLVDENQMTGTIPENLGKATSLYSLILTDNYFNGTIPSHLEHLTELQTFKLDTNFFSGTIPSSSQFWTRLNEIYLQTTFIMGTLSDWIGNWQNLTELVIFDTQLSGSLPQSLNLLKELEKIYMYQNRLNGTLPSGLSKLTKLAQLEVHYNEISGSIPDELCNVINLRTLLLNQNRMNGSIPACIGDLKHLMSFQAYNNMLTGRIPESIANCYFLESVEIENNFLSHHIPSNITNMALLTQFTASNNLLSGSIPENIQFTLLEVLYLDNNLMTGTLPESLPITMTKISLRGNSFHGTLPSLWWNSVSYVMDVALNQLESNLTGILHHRIAPVYVFINSNQFYGHFFGDIGDEDDSKAFALQIINATDNYLSGTLSSRFSRYIDMTQFLLADNFMVGSIAPNIFYQMHSLASLDLGNNFFTGSLPATLINSTAQFFILDINSNSFTGTIPPSLFAVTNLQSVVLSINCLSGTLPDSICTSPGMIELLLDGLHASKHCRYETFPGTKLHMGIFQSGFQVRGSIPSCIWALPSLQTLHLSGNSLQGQISLPDIEVEVEYNSHSHFAYNSSKYVGYFSHSLMNLDLSHNRLTGSIPRSIWTHNFTTLDVSFNRIRGTIPESISTIYQQNNQSMLNLEVNRLSGAIPQTLLEAEHVNMLEGNLFGCSIDRREHDLPKYDPNFSNYQCGSEYTNFAMISFGIVFIVLCTSFAIRYFRYERPEWKNEKDRQENSFHSFLFIPLGFRYKQWMSIFHPKGSTIPDPNISYIAFAGLVLQRWIRWIRILLLYVLFIGMPLFIILSTYYGTYDRQYIWTVSPSFISGSVPAILIFLFLLGLIVLILRMNVVYHTIPSTVFTINQGSNEPKKEENIHNSDATSFSGKNSSGPWNIPTLLLNAAFIVINSVVVVSVNAAYIVAINQQYTGTVLFFISISLSIFKILWGGLLTFYYQRSLHHNYECEYTMSLIGLTIFNSIVAPYIADMIISPDCFKYAIQSPPEITSSIQGVPCYYAQREKYEAVSDVEITSIQEFLVCQTQPNFPSNVTVLFVYESSTSILFTPVFTYNYQCSSSVITSFAYIFVIRYTLGGMLLPLLQVLMKWMVTHHVAKTGLKYCNSFIYLMNSLLPPLLRLNYTFDEEEESEMHLTKNINAVNPVHQSPVNADAVNIDSVETSLNITPPNDNIVLLGIEEWNCDQLSKMMAAPINPAQTLRVMFARDFAVLLTFGVLFPPLFVIIVLAMVVQIHKTQMSIGRLYRMLQLLDHPVTLKVNDIAIVNRRQEYKQQLTSLVQKINISFADFDQMLWQSLYFSTSFAAVFWSLSLFDILADANDTYSHNDNIAQNIWIFTLTCTAPHWLYGFDFLCARLYRYHSGQDSNHKEAIADEKNKSTVHIEDIHSMVEMQQTSVLPHSSH